MMAARIASTFQATVDVESITLGSISISETGFSSRWLNIIGKDGSEVSVLLFGTNGTIATLMPKIDTEVVDSRTDEDKIRDETLRSMEVEQ